MISFNNNFVHDFQNKYKFKIFNLVFKISMQNNSHKNCERYELLTNGMIRSQETEV